MDLLNWRERGDALIKSNERPTSYCHWIVDDPIRMFSLGKR